MPRAYDDEYTNPEDRRPSQRTIEEQKEQTVAEGDAVSPEIGCPEEVLSNAFIAAERDVDFYVLGPSESVGDFTMSPDRKKAYGLHEEVGNYQFWTFDLEKRRVEGKTEFAGRSRMGLQTSSNGQLLYIYNAGNTIDIYDAATYRHLRTVELDADMTSFILLPSGGR